MTGKKKILFILHFPPPMHGSSVVGKQLKDSKLINSQFVARYINLSTSRSVKDIGKYGLIKLLQYFKINFQTLKFLIFFKPDLVYITMTSKGSGFYKDLPIVLLVKIIRRQLVIHFHNKGVSENQNNGIDNLLYKMVFKKSKVILLSKYLYYDIKKYIKELDVYYCSNGIPLKIRETKNILPKNTVQLLFLSNIIESKGVFVLLEALKVLKKEGLNFNCNFVGAIGDISLDRFHLQVDNFDLSDHVSYLGPKTGKEKHHIFNSSDIFVLPTLNDCFPLVVLEAMKHELPVVSTVEGAILEMVDDGITGFLVPLNDPEALAEKLGTLITKSNLRQQFGEAGKKKYLEKFTLEHFEQRMFTILNHLVSINA